MGLKIMVAEASTIAMIRRQNYRETGPHHHFVSHLPPDTSSRSSSQRLCMMTKISARMFPVHHLVRFNVESLPSF